MVNKWKKCLAMLSVFCIRNNQWWLGCILEKDLENVQVAQFASSVWSKSIIPISSYTIDCHCATIQGCPVG